MQTARRNAFLAVVAIGIVGCASTAKRTPAIPHDHIVTPQGMVDRSCVWTIAKRDRVDDQGNVTHANGKREKLPQCKQPRPDSRPLQPTASAGSVSPTGSYWVEFASWNASPPANLGTLTATFTVPPAPSTPGGTIFFFPGLMSNLSPPNTILQPVIEYGACNTGVGNCWTASSWYCCPNSVQTNTEPFGVNAGDTIVGTISCTGVPCTWLVQINDTTTNQSATLMVDTSAAFPVILGGVLEAHNLVSCGQYPATSQTAFDVALTDQSGNPLQPVWIGSTVPMLPQCGYNVSAPAPGNVITLLYQP